MTDAITIDELETGYHEAAAAASRTTAAVKKNVTIWTISADLWNVNRKLKHLVGMHDGLDFRSMDGLACQHLEKGLAELIEKLDEVVEIGKQKGFHNRTLTGGALYSIAGRSEELKDIWVALSSSTDAELDETLTRIKGEETVPWESVRR